MEWAYSFIWTDTLACRLEAGLLYIEVSVNQIKKHVSTRKMELEIGHNCRVVSLILFTQTYSDAYNGIEIWYRETSYIWKIDQTMPALEWKT